MADIRINQLPLATGPTEATPTDFIPIDGTTTRKVSLANIADVVRPMASQAEAEAGLNSVKGMSPLTTAQAIAVQAATAAQGSLADTALQPSSIGVSVQEHSDNLDTLSAVVPGVAGTTILSLSASVNVRNFLSVIPYVTSRANLKAVDTSLDAACFLTEGGREGVFIWRTGDYSTQIAADTAEGIYIKANAIASNAGAWVRQFEGVQDIRWFGGIGNNAFDNASAFSAAGALGGQIYVPDGTFRVNLTTANYDSLASGNPGIFARCIGSGFIRGVCSGSVTSSAQFGVYNQETCRIQIEGSIVSGNLTAANVAITGSAGAYSAAVTFPSLPAGIAVGQLLSLATTDRTVPAVILCGALRVTNVAGNIVTVAFSHPNGTFSAPPASLSFTGAYTLATSNITYTNNRTLCAITASGAKVKFASIGLLGPGGANTVALSIGIKDETTQFSNCLLEATDVLINGFAYGIQGLGGKLNIQRPHVALCTQGIRLMRMSEAYMTNVRVGNNSDTGIHIDSFASAVHDGEGMACANGNRGVWNFTGRWYSSGAFETSYNDVGVYAKNGSVVYSAPNSRARFNDGIGFGNENSFVNLISTFSLDNRVTGYECGAGGFTDASLSQSLRNEQGFYALISAGIEAAGAEAGYSTAGHGFSAGEGSTIRAKNSSSHHNSGDGYRAGNQSHIRKDDSSAYSNTGYGARALVNSTIVTPGTATYTPANTAGATNADPTSSAS